LNSLIKSSVSRKLIFLCFFILLILIFLLSISVGSVKISIFDTLRIVLKKFFAVGDISDLQNNLVVIIEKVRIPRVLLSALVGAALSISGTAMQGLLRNPLADSSTLGVSTGGALGAVITIAIGFELPFFPTYSITIMSILFAFVTLIVILTLSYKISYNLSSSTIILMGVIVSMFAGSLISFIVTMSEEKLKSIVFWTMGSFSGRGYEYVWLVLPFFIIGILGLLRYSRELNAFALGEEKAGYIGVKTKKVKIMILIFVSVLVGVSVSVSGTIAFVGLVIPHITRMLIGPNHKHLMPLSIVSGACFLMLTDLISRTVFSPSELPIGVVTSLIGSVIFINIFYAQRQKQ
jgi:iron complex transport system permease protein